MRRSSVPLAARYQKATAKPPCIMTGRIPTGSGGTSLTIEHLKQLVHEGAGDFYVRQHAIDVLFQREVRAKDYLGEIRALFEWVQNHIRYTKDPVGIETVHSARRMLELRAGDCDDQTILLGALLQSVGHPVQLVLAGRNPRRPMAFSHVYLEVFHEGRWLALDPTMPNQVGWEPRRIVRKVFPVMPGPNVTGGEGSSWSRPGTRQLPTTGHPRLLDHSATPEQTETTRPRVTAPSEIRKLPA